MSLEEGDWGVSDFRCLFATDPECSEVEAFDPLLLALQ